MFYRRKILLSLLEHFGELSKTKLQKILFVYTRLQEKKAFDFVPYKYGCYSFQANMDLEIMQRKNLITQITNEDNKSIYWKLVASNSFKAQLKKEDKKNIIRLENKIGNLSQDELIKYTYVKYPFFAINSRIAHRLLSNLEIEQVEKQKRKFEEPVLFTIGYEGISLEKYINKLIINDVKLLCDVRKNSFSMKYGFSKKQLSNACESVNIKFLHIPDLGIVSEKRKELNNMGDYNKLFEEYEKTVIANNQESLKKIAKLFAENNRIALTCFEKEVCMCHRGRVAKALKALPNWDIRIKHIT